MPFHLAYFLTPQFTALGRAIVTTESLLDLGFFVFAAIVLTLEPPGAVTSQSVDRSCYDGG